MLSQGAPFLDYEPQVVDKDVLPQVPGPSTWLMFAFAITVIIGGFLIVDVLMPQFFGPHLNIVFWLVLLNVVVAQLTLICIWGTLVEGTFWVRVPWTALQLVISWAALSWGVHLQQGSAIDPAAIPSLGLVWLFGFIVSYLPLKMFAWLLGWRIRQAKGPAPAPSSHYAIRDMMIGTALLAVVMAIGRLLIPGDLPTWAQTLNASGFDQIERILLLSIFSVISLVVKLPCIWIALAMAKEKIVFRGVVWIVVSGLIAMLEFGILCTAVGPPGSEWLKVLVGIILGHMVMAAVMLGVLYFLRCYGYSMSRIKKRTTNSVTEV